MFSKKKHLNHLKGGNYYEEKSFSRITQRSSSSIYGGSHSSNCICG